jgi:hypothetical protein
MKALKLAPGFMDAYFLRGKYNYEFGFYNKALQDFNIYLLTNQTDHESLMLYVANALHVKEIIA